MIIFVMFYVFNVWPPYGSEPYGSEPCFTFGDLYDYNLMIIYGDAMCLKRVFINWYLLWPMC